jgi:hypothetical protein
MSMRIIEVIVSRDDLEKILRETRGPEVVDVWCILGAEYGQMVVRVLAPMTECQALIDKFQGILGGDKHRIVLIPTLAVIPDPSMAEQAADVQQKSSTAAREELYNTVTDGATVDSTFVLVIFLSTLVAGIGLIKDNVAVVIGAMVIAPLLGRALHSPSVLRSAISQPRCAATHLVAEKGSAPIGGLELHAVGGLPADPASNHLPAKRQELVVTAGG